MNLAKFIPPYITDDELTKQLENYPSDDEKMILTKSERMLRLLDLYNIFVPTQMSKEIYGTIYFALVRSLERKSNLYNNLQMEENRKIINGMGIPRGINGGDCSLIVGESGIGKTQSIARVVHTITNDTVIEVDDPHCSIIPIMIVEASPTVSVKGFLLEILRVMDSMIGTNYYESNNRSTINTDALLGAVSNALLLHCGVLIVDEVDRLVGNKKSMMFVNVITELLNMCGISVIFVGTLRALDFFRNTEYLARRSMGNIYRRMPLGDEYCNFCKKLFQYQYTPSRYELNNDMLLELHKLSSGITALTVQLFITAQQLALDTNRPCIDLLLLSKAFTDKMGILVPFISMQKQVLSVPKSESLLITPSVDEGETDKVCLFVELAKKSNKDFTKAIEILRKNITVDEITI